MQIDVIPAADGTPIVVRDLNLQRITGVDKDVTDITPKDLPKLRDPLKQDILFQEGKPIRTSAFGEWGRRIPTLEQVFSMAGPETHFIIELWAEDQALVSEVARLVELYGYTKRVTLGNPFSAKCYKLCRKALPEAQHMYPVEMIWQVYLAYMICMLWSFKILHPFPLGTVFNIPLINKRWEQLVVEHKLNGFKAWIVRTTLRFMSWLIPAPKLFKHLQEEGCPVIAYVLNDEEEWAFAQKLGVAAVTTDFPAKMIKFLSDTSRGLANGTHDTIANKKEL